MIDRGEISARKRVVALDIPVPVKRRIAMKQAAVPLLVEAPTEPADEGLAPGDTLDEEAEEADDLALLLQGSAKGKAQEEEEAATQKPLTETAPSTDVGAAKAASSSSSSSSSSEEEEEDGDGGEEEVEARGEPGGGEAQGAGDAAGDGGADEEARIEHELCRLFDGDAEEADADGPAGDDALGDEDGCEATAEDPPAGDEEILFEDAEDLFEEAADGAADGLAAGDEKDEEEPGSQGLNEDENKPAGTQDSDGSSSESDASSSSSSSSAAPPAESDGSGPLSPTEEKLEIKLVADLQKLPESGPRRAGRFRQLSQWVRNTAATEGFGGVTLSRAQVEALLFRVSKKLSDLPVPPAVATPAGREAATTQPRRLRGAPAAKAGSGAARLPPRRAPAPAAAKPQDPGRPGFSVPRHRELPPPGRPSLAGAGRPSRGHGGSGARGGATFEEEQRLLVKVFRIVSHRYDDLWFENPGQHVMCNWCGEEFSQAGGQLQGADGRSQFAQNQFVCHPCLQMAGEDESEAE